MNGWGSNVSIKKNKRRSPDNEIENTNVNIM